ncbi:MAG: glycosyltransferase, partial [Chitinophagaceae bacterium]
RNIDFIFYLVGDGPFKKQYEMFIKEHALTNKIHLTGKLKTTELRNLYRQSDFLIQASLLEGYGKVPVEGYFHGVVPFLNSTPMAKEILGDGKCGYEFEAKDPIKFAEFLLEKIQEHKLLAEKIIAGRNYCKVLTLEKWSSEMLEIVEKYYEN